MRGGGPAINRGLTCSFIALPGATFTLIISSEIVPLGSTLTEWRQQTHRRGCSERAPESRNFSKKEHFYPFFSKERKRNLVSILRFEPVKAAMKSPAKKWNPAFQPPALFFSCIEIKSQKLTYRPAKKVEPMFPRKTRTYFVE